MRISDKGVALIKQFEGLRLSAYQDIVGVWTIGYGHTATARSGMTITEGEAEQLLRDDLDTFESAVNRLVSVPLTQGQFDALVSFAFNVGAGALERSTLLRKLNERDYAGAAEQFRVWTRAGGKVINGLVRRRAAERELFWPSEDAAVTAPERPIAQPETKGRAMAPALLMGILAALKEAIPAIGKLFAKSDVAERNLVVAERVVEMATQVSGAVNAQQMVEQVRDDPEIARRVEDEIKREWIDLVEAGGGGIAGARKADLELVSVGGSFLRSPSFWMAIAMLPLVYLIVLSLIGIIGTAEWAADVRSALAGSISGAIVGGILGYYFGQTTSRNRS